jgi:hypothetical protein
MKLILPSSVRVVEVPAPLIEIHPRCIHQLRRAAELLAPTFDIAEIEEDLALEMEPRSKFDRLVLASRGGRPPI